MPLLNFRRAAVALALGFIGFASQSLPAADPAPLPNPRRANLILIVADGLGFGDIGCYGQTRIKTPHLDQLAAGGVRFTSFYAASPAAATARAALLTGRDAGHLEVTDDAAATLPFGTPTLAEILMTAGYHTACIGVWGLGSEGSVNVPPKRGYQEWVGYLTAAEAQTEYPVSLWRYDPPGEAKTGYDGRIDFTKNAFGAKNMAASEIFTTAAKNFINIAQPDQFNRYRPFFLQLNYTLPRVDDLDSAAPYELEPWPRAAKYKAAAIARLDNHIGELIEQLKKYKLESNTVVIVTSATGPEAAGADELKLLKRSGPFAAGDLREAGIRVPLLVWSPGKVKAGEENFLPCAAYDLLPTFAEIARAQPPARMDGLSLWPQLQGRAQAQRHDFLYWELHGTNQTQAVRSGNWKAVRPQASQPWQLFSLTADAAEQTDLAAQHPEILAKVADYLKTRR